MKSIMEEGSTVFKAVENAWIRAGKPQEFSVTVFEAHEKNFFGFTSKPAKIGLFFDERQVARAEGEKDKSAARARRHSEQPQQRPQRQQSQREHREHREPREYRERTERPERAPRHHESAERSERFEQPSTWNDEMIAQVKAWMRNTLEGMGASSVSDEYQVRDEQLTINLSSPLCANEHQERSLARSLSYLILQYIRHIQRKRLKGLRVHVMTAQ